MLDKQNEKLWQAEQWGLKGNSSINEHCKRHWIHGVQNELTKTNIIDLARGNIPAIYISSFIDEVTASAIRHSYSGLTQSYYENVIPRIKKFGPTVFEYKFADRKDYFFQARETRKLLLSVMKDILSPLEIFRHNLKEQCGWSSNLAEDHLFGKYFAGTFRSIEEGTPVHIDFAPHESPEWEMISSVKAQLTANIYLDAPPEGGNLVIYEKLWNPEDERYRFKNRFGYADAAIEATSFETIKPRDCAISLFNSQFFHRVDPSWQRRLTLSFFFALQKDSLIFWS
jgi:hypothetical protein